MERLTKFMTIDYRRCLSEFYQLLVFQQRLTKFMTIVFEQTLLENQ